MNLPAAITLAAAVAMAGVAAYLWRHDGASRAGAANGAASSSASSEAWRDTIPHVRVLLGSHGRKYWTIRIEGPYQVTALGDWHVLAQGESLAEAQAAASEAGLTVGSKDFAAGRLTLSARRDGSLWVGSRRYRGSLDLVALPDGRVQAINRLPLEDYLASVLSGEMPADFPTAAQEAQAIVSRTYALFHMKTVGQHRDFDLTDGAGHQEYLGMEYTDGRGRRLAAETTHSRKMIERTRGVALLYEGRLFCSYFGAVCGGHTADGRSLFGVAPPPLIGVRCEFCSSGPKYHWDVALPRATAEPRIQEWLAREGHDLGRLVDVHVVERGQGVVPSVEWRGERGSCTVSAARLREALFAAELPSPFYSLELDATQLTAKGRGWGHCAGFCQWGAKGQADLGRTTMEILAYYYPGSRLGHVH